MQLENVCLCKRQIEFISPPVALHTCDMHFNMNVLNVKCVTNNNMEHRWYADDYVSNEEIRTLQIRLGNICSIHKKLVFLFNYSMLVCVCCWQFLYALLRKLMRSDVIFICTKRILTWHIFHFIHTQSAFMY